MAEVEKDEGSAKFKAAGNAFEMEMAFKRDAQPAHLVQSREKIVNIPKCRISLPLIHLLFVHFFNLFIGWNNIVFRGSDSISRYLAKRILGSLLVTGSSTV